MGTSRVWHIITKHFRYLKWRYKNLCKLYQFGLCKGFPPPPKNKVFCTCKIRYLKLLVILSTESWLVQKIGIFISWFMKESLYNWVGCHPLTQPTNQPTNQPTRGFSGVQRVEVFEVGLEVQNLIPKNLNHQSLGSRENKNHGRRIDGFFWWCLLGPNGCVGLGDDVLPSYIGMIINHEIRIPFLTNKSWNVRRSGTLAILRSWPFGGWWVYMTRNSKVLSRDLQQLGDKKVANWITWFLVWIFFCRISYIR